jgi:hypothetical protein
MIESSDVKGIPVVDRDSKAVTWVQPNFLAHMGPGIIFFDELTQARREVLAASYPIFLDREVDGHHFDDGAIIIGAGNDTGDGAIANELGTALNDRVLHLYVTASLASFLRHHESLGTHPAVMALVQQMPHLLSCNTRRINEDLTASPTMRAWERVSHLLYQFLGDQPKDEKRLKTAEIVASGVVGAEAAGHLILTVRDINECANPAQLLKTPLAKVEPLLPHTVRAGVALAFAFGHICNDAASIVKAAAIIAKFEHKPAQAMKSTIDGVPMKGREIATLGVERLIRKAEDLKLMAQIADGRLEGSDVLFAYTEQLAERHAAAMGERAA